MDFHFSSSSGCFCVVTFFFCPTTSLTSVGDPVDPVGDQVDPVLIPWRRFVPLSDMLLDLPMRSRYGR